jgi:hypothetical protein
MEANRCAARSARDVRGPGRIVPPPREAEIPATPNHPRGRHHPRLRPRRRSLCHGPEPIAAEPRSPDLSAYRLRDLPRTPDLVKGSGDLASLSICSDHFCSSDKAYRFVSAT